jgi:fructoselysine and glucoselysine-specific PTS system IID component
MTTNSSNASAADKNGEAKSLSKKEFWQVFWRSCQLDVSWNYERQQNLGYSYALTPVTKKFYEPKSDKMKEAYHRGLDFMAITPQISTLLMGIDIALQEQDAKDESFDGSTIAGIKTSLMGPLAGIGDSLIPGTLRIIATGIAIGFCQQGSWLGPLLFLLVFNVPGFLLRYFGLKWGYEKGASFITDTEKSGVMQKVTYVASIVGLAAIGAMVASYVYIDIPIMVGSGDFATPLMDYVNDIMPCLPQLGLFGLMYWLLGKDKLSATWILVLTIVICIAVCFVFGL